MRGWLSHTPAVFPCTAQQWRRLRTYFSGEVAAKFATALASFSLGECQQPEVLQE